MTHTDVKWTHLDLKILQDHPLFRICLNMVTEPQKVQAHLAGCTGICQSGRCMMVIQDIPVG